MKTKKDRQKIADALYRARSAMYSSSMSEKRVAQDEINKLIVEYGLIRSWGSEVDKKAAFKRVKGG